MHSMLERCLFSYTPSENVKTYLIVMRQSLELECMLLIIVRVESTEICQIICLSIKIPVLQDRLRHLGSMKIGKDLCLILLRILPLASQDTLMSMKHY